MFFDTHTHLNDAKFDLDRGEILAALEAANVRQVVEIADAPADWEKAIALSRARPWVRCSLGLHPYHADDWQPELAKELLRKSSLPEVVACGEIGLDYAKAPATPAAQKRALDGMLHAAWEANLPVVIHCREAYMDLIPILKAFYEGKSPRGRFHGVVHCFSGTGEDAKACAGFGFALGVDGPITYPKTDALRIAIKSAGLDVVVMETDSPYLPPQSSRGKRNDPRAIPEIAEQLAWVFETSPHEVGRLTTRNARDLYRIDEQGRKSV
ncbi:MAG: TatD family hydrolase [Elusimicrobia bacterium]|nr:TatD family hydrolase [Elusimicrobiota bacterium]